MTPLLFHRQEAPGSNTAVRRAQGGVTVPASAGSPLPHALAFRGSVCVLCFLPARPSPPGKLGSFPSSPHTCPSSVTSVPTPLVCAGSGAHATLRASDLLSWFFPPSAQRPQDRAGLGQGSACSKCSVGACGHRIRCSEWWQEHSRRQLPCSMLFPGREVIKFFPFSQEALLNLLPKSLQVSMYR